MEPRVQYAKSSDGVSIAFWTVGEGRALIGVPTGPWGIAMEARHPGWRSWYERLARRHMVVLYDSRGTGLSGGVREWSLGSQTRDLDAVSSHLDLASFALEGPPFGGPAAIAYAANHPERVSHLILWNTWARTADAVGSSQAQSLLALIDKDWEVFTETLAHVIFGWSSGAEAHELAVAFRENFTRDSMLEYMDALIKLDATDFLAQVRSKTLVVHSREGVFPSLDVAQGLASRIPNARFVLLEGQSVPWLGDMERNACAHEDFLGTSGGSPSYASVEAPSSVAVPPVEPTRGMAVILFADIVDSTGLTERMGDALFREKARKLDDALRPAIRKSGGTPVEGKLLGDGVLAVFMSAQQAIEAALGCAVAGDSAGLRLHLGIHAGDVIREEDPDGRANVYGGTVNTAARIAAVSAPGEVLVSDTVRGLARTSAGVTFEDRGDHDLKGMSDATHLYAVRRQGTPEVRRSSEPGPSQSAAGPGLTGPDIQYVRTPDGVSIAFSTIGEGRPIVFVPQFPWSHIQMEWEMPGLREFWTGVARTMRVIRYDARGTGLSDRGVNDLTPDAQLRDLDAVVQSLGLESFALMAATSGGPMAIEYAGRHADRVSHLVLWCTATRVSDVYQAGSEALLSMAITNWHFFTQAIAHSTFSWLHADEAQQMAAFLRACVTPETLIASMPAFRALDATPYLSAVAARTLVMTRRSALYLGPDVARGLASQITGARLVVVEGSSIAPFGDEGDILEVLREFLSEESEVAASRIAVDRPVSLTARETEVLSLLASGRSGKEIAAELSVSLSTVQRHIANVYAKIGVRGRVEAAAYALARGLVQPRSD